VVQEFNYCCISAVSLPFRFTSCWLLSLLNSKLHVEGTQVSVSIRSVWRCTERHYGRNASSNCTIAGRHRNLWGSKGMTSKVCAVKPAVMSSIFTICGVGRDSPLDTWATNGPVVLAQDHRWRQNIRWNNNWQRKPKYSEITCPNVTLFTTNSTSTDLGSNLGSYDWKPATPRLSHSRVWWRVSSDVN
jgi:hypothetical protein